MAEAITEAAFGDDPPFRIPVGAYAEEFTRIRREQGEEALMQAYLARRDD